MHIRRSTFIDLREEARYKMVKIQKLFNVHSPPEGTLRFPTIVSLAVSSSWPMKFIQPTVSLEEKKAGFDDD